MNADLDKPAHIRQKISVLAGALLAALAWTPIFFAAQATFGIQPASVRSHYGILGSQAPELDITPGSTAEGKRWFTMAFTSRWARR